MGTTGRIEPTDRGADCGFRLYNFDHFAFPLLLSVPHAGRDYPKSLYDNLRIAPAELLRLEDRYADRLISPAIAAGIPAIVAHRARAWIDLNRSEDELDAGMLADGKLLSNRSGSAKMRGGLGLIPRRLMHFGEIWKRPFDAEDVAFRIESYHRRYHETIESTLSQIVQRFGVAILIDLHSMPPLKPLTGPTPQIVVGDRFGQSAGSIYSGMLLERLKQVGIAAALNHPYSGDYVLRHHGRTRSNIHAIQIEIDRSLYLDSELREPGEGLAATAAIITELLTMLVDLTGGGSVPIAAE